jgi:hypothetical protein
MLNLNFDVQDKIKNATSLTQERGQGRHFIGVNSEARALMELSTPWTERGL